jgi:hypothetical protein
VTNLETGKSYFLPCVRFVNHGDPRLDTMNACVEELLLKASADEYAAIERGSANVEGHSSGE